MTGGKWIDGLDADTPLADAARRVLRVRLEVVQHYLPLALDKPDEDPEHVHQLRVGTRRAGAALRIFRPCLPDRAYRAARKHLRRLRRAAGEARDWDVFLLDLKARQEEQTAREQPGFDVLSGYAASRRQTAQDRLRAAAPEDPHALPHLVADTAAAVGPPGPDHGARILLDLARPQLAGLVHELDRAAAGDLKDYAVLHQVRIAGKRLRYAMEVFGDCFPPMFRDELYPAVEEMQEVLGLANDSHVASGNLSELRERLRGGWPADWKRWKSGVESVLRYHQRRLTQQRRRFLQWWDRWQRSDLEAAFVSLLQPEPVSSEAG